MYKITIWQKLDFYDKFRLKKSVASTKVSVSAESEKYLEQRGSKSEDFYNISAFWFCQYLRVVLLVKISTPQTILIFLIQNTPVHRFFYILLMNCKFNTKNIVVSYCEGTKHTQERRDCVTSLSYQPGEKRA